MKFMTLMTLTALSLTAAAPAFAQNTKCDDDYNQWREVAHKRSVEKTVLRDTGIVLGGIAVFSALPVVGIAAGGGLTLGSAGIGVAVGSWLGLPAGGIMSAEIPMAKSSLDHSLTVVDWANAGDSSYSPDFPSELKKTHEKLMVAQLEQQFKDSPKPVRDEAIRQHRHDLDFNIEAELRTYVLAGLSDGSFCSGKEPAGIREVVKYVNSKAGIR
jgi:hypothetical protein